MICCAVQNNQLKPGRGNSGSRPDCTATLFGSFIGDNMKTCKICGGQYSSSDTCCKKCDAERNKRYRQANKEKEVVRKRLYNLNHRKELCLTSKIYGKKHREEIRIRNRRYYRRFPEKRKCFRIVREAKKKGELIVGKCVDCGITPQKARIDAHHKDYGKPLDVIWLCVSCHRRRHRSIA